MKKREYPKKLYVKQTCVPNGEVRFFEQTVKNQKDHASLIRTAANMLPNFTNEISETPFKK